MFTDKKHIFFDLDHTLWDFDKNSGLAFEKIFKNMDLKVSVNDFLQVYIPTNQKYWRLYQANKISHEELRFYRLKDVFDVLQYPIDEQLILELSEEYIAYLPENNHLFDGALEVLDYLMPNYQLHIITNGFSHVQDKKIKNSNIHRYFKTVTNSDVVGQKKPHFDIFDYALKSAQASKNDSIMIGDSYEADVLGALDFGMNAIYFNENKMETSKNVFQINHLLELKNIL